MPGTRATQRSAFGVQLRRLRESAGLSQEALAERAALTAKAIGALERGERRRPYPHTVQLLADALALDEASRRALIEAVPRASQPVVSDGGGFIGRQDQMARLRAWLAQAVSGWGGIVTLVGEAGIGKTRVAREFSAGAAAQGAVVLWGRCFEGDWQPAYGPWVEAIGEYLAAQDAERVRRELGAGSPFVARILPELQASLPELPAPSSLSPSDERFRLFEAISRFLARVSERQPCLLVLDDLHWADLDSLRLLRHVARFAGRGRLLLLGIYRDPEVGLAADHPLRTTLATLRREGPFEQVVLEGLGPDEMAAYLAVATGQGLPDGLVRLIEEETRGNPFFAGEIVRHLRDGALLSQPGGTGSLTLEVNKLGIPEGVREIVAHRVARLSSDTGRVLAMASGFGGRFEFAVMERLSGVPEGTLLDCFDEAIGAGLIRVAGEPPSAYEFSHAIVRHALYDRLNPDRRTRLHRKIAVALEETHAGHELDYAAELATQYHASAGLGSAGDGLRYALAVAWQARAAYAHERAVAFLRMARDLAAESSPAEQAEILRRLALAEADAIHLEEARKSGELAVEAMRRADADGRACAEFMATLAGILKDCGAKPSMWQSLVEGGLALVGDGRDLVWARLELLRDNYEPVGSGPIHAGRWLGLDPTAESLARAEGDEEDYARTLEPLEWRSRAETEELLARVRSWSRPPAILRGLEVVGRDLIYRDGAFREALVVYSDLLEASGRFGSVEARSEALTMIGVCQVSTGDLSGTRQTLAQAEEVVSRLGPSHRLRFVTTGMAIGLAYYLEGDWALLGESSRRYAMAEDSMRSSLGMISASYVAICAAREGDRDKALRWIEPLASASEQVPVATYAQSWVIAGTAAAIWESEARAYARRYRRLLIDLMRTGLGDPGVWGPFELALARMTALDGDLLEAEGLFERARGKLEALRHAPGTAIVDYDLACSESRRTRSERNRVIELLDRASAAFQELGMLGWVARAADEKGRLGPAQ
jgi:transcriptional regulator with XRE-family HTH domain